MWIKMDLEYAIKELVRYKNGETSFLNIIQYLIFHNDPKLWKKNDELMIWAFRGE